MTRSRRFSTAVSCSEGGEGACATSARGCSFKGAGAGAEGGSAGGSASVAASESLSVSSGTSAVPARSERMRAFSARRSMFSSRSASTCSGTFLKRTLLNWGELVQNLSFGVPRTRSIESATPWPALTHAQNENTASPRRRWRWRVAVRTCGGAGGGGSRLPRRRRRCRAGRSPPRPNSAVSFSVTRSFPVSDSDDRSFQRWSKGPWHYRTTIDRSPRDTQSHPVSHTSHVDLYTYVRILHMQVAGLGSPRRRRGRAERAAGPREAAAAAARQSRPPRPPRPLSPDRACPHTAPWGAPCVSGRGPAFRFLKEHIYGVRFSSFRYKGTCGEVQRAFQALLQSPHQSPTPSQKKKTRVEYPRTLAASLVHGVAQFCAEFGPLLRGAALGLSTIWNPLRFRCRDASGRTALFPNLNIVLTRDTQNSPIPSFGRFWPPTTKAQYRRPDAVRFVPTERRYGRLAFVRFEYSLETRKDSSRECENPSGDAAFQDLGLDAGERELLLEGHAVLGFLLGLSLPCSTRLPNASREFPYRVSPSCGRDRSERDS